MESIEEYRERLQKWIDDHKKKKDSHPSPIDDVPVEQTSVE